MSISNIKEYTQQFGMFGEPIEYNGLNIYPILVKDAYALDEHINILNIEKKKFGIEAIQQSYLYFMVCFMMEIPASIKSFLWIVEKVLHIEYDESIVIEGFERGEILAKDDEDDDSVVLLINGYPIAFELNGRKASILGIVGNLFLFIIKIIVGFIFKSEAMIADAMNSGSDVFNSLMTYVGNRIASHDADAEHNLGYGKAEYVYAMLISITMIILSWYFSSSIGPNNNRYKALDTR